MIKSIIIIAAAILSTAAFAQDDCRSLSTVEKRNECNVKKTMSELLPTAPASLHSKPVTAQVPDRVDDLSRENERVSAKLKGICRGC
jgi:hypothetical protein